jgi:2-keto-4-pentenoate hydratase/2-oxohepta-3-ene-1,7-dioic acid hydratase in catechol pathway
MKSDCHLACTDKSRSTTSNAGHGELLMRLITFRQGDGEPRAGVLLAERVIDIGVLGYPSTIESWLAAPPETAASLALALTAHTVPPLSLTDVWLAAPIRTLSKLVAIGVNYLDHCREQGIEPPQAPFIFSTFPSTIIGPHDSITWDSTLTQQVDPEIELGVVIGRRCRAVSVDEALSYVFGHTIVNDVSARDWQLGEGQWTRGKRLAMFCPLGPCVVTADEIPDPQNLRLRLWVNGRLQQDGTTPDMIFTVAQIIAHVTRFSTLEPGDLITTGTPSDVGSFRHPPFYLAPGDVIRCAIESTGELVNPTRVSASPATTARV